MKWIKCQVKTAGTWSLQCSYVPKSWQNRFQSGNRIPAASFQFVCPPGKVIAAAATQKIVSLHILKREHVALKCHCTSVQKLGIIPGRELMLSSVMFLMAVYCDPCTSLSTCWSPGTAFLLPLFTCWLPGVALPLYLPNAHCLMWLPWPDMKNLLPKQTNYFFNFFSPGTGTKGNPLD